MRKTLWLVITWLWMITAWLFIVGFHVSWCGNFCLELQRRVNALEIPPTNHEGEIQVLRGQLKDALRRIDELEQR